MRTSRGDANDDDDDDDVDDDLDDYNDDDDDDDDNECYSPVGNVDLDHAYWGRPEDMTMNRPVYKLTTSQPGSDLAGETAAAFAAGYLAFKDTGRSDSQLISQ